MSRLAVDIGGTFTDVVLETGGELVTSKVLTTSNDPAQGVLEGVEVVLAQTQVAAADIGLVLHGTTLATNALIERRGAKTALLSTHGHRDVLEMAFENRFEQYDVNIDRPVPLVPRHWRRDVWERIAADGQILRPLDIPAMLNCVDELVGEGVKSLAIGFLHSYQNPEHEMAAAKAITDRYPDLALSCSADVCPEIREYERFSTTVANAYVKPLMAEYLSSLDVQLKDRGIVCQTLLMTSGGGLTTLDAARAYPIRLVESGPAGGAMLAADIAKRYELDSILSFDMGGTTAKICLIDEGTPLYSRAFEVDRSYRFKKGSGLPVRIPVVEMVEIGAGGGSIAHVDGLKRLLVGPESAGSEPGPACYGRGGEEATVTDADVVLGRLSAAHFAGGKIELDAAASAEVISRDVGTALSQNMHEAAYAVSEIVEENMASAARAHASEWGRDLQSRTMVAFGGAAPLHAVSLARKLRISSVVIPPGAGVGSAIGFLLAPVKFEVVRSDLVRLNDLQVGKIEPMLADMRNEAGMIVTSAGFGQTLVEQISAYMRYLGQGYEVAVEVDDGQLDPLTLRERFETVYAGLYGRTIPEMDIEVLSWTLSLASEQAQTEIRSATTHESERKEGPLGAIAGFDGERRRDVPVYLRSTLSSEPKMGPALVVEAQTCIVVPEDISFCQDSYGALHLEEAER